MDLWEYRTFFNEQIAKLPPRNDGIVLDSAHLFLQMALEHISGCSDPQIGNFEIDERGIKYDGYYYNEDEHEYHLLSLIYFDNIDNLQAKDVREACGDARHHAMAFLHQALDRGRSNIPTENIVGEHVQELIDDVASSKVELKIFIDFFSNADLPISDLPGVDASINSRSIFLSYYDAPAIYDMISADETSGMIVEFKKDWKAPLLAIRVARNPDFDVYLTSITGDVLAQVYDKHKDRLMDGNVRAYLKRTQKTNHGISQTLKTDPQCFVAYNNGISAVASADGSDIQPLDANVFLINALEKMQIVNGGQTTITIYMASKDPTDLSNVTVPMKLTVLKKQDQESDFVSNIAIYANTQTAIAKSDLASNKPFYKYLESLSRSNPCYRTDAHKLSESYYWFFERSNGLYNTRRRIIWNYSKTFERQFPERYKFSKKALAKAIMAVSCKPNIVCLGNEKCFQEFNKIITDNNILPNQKYYQNCIAALILWREADKIIKKDGLPIKAAILPYTLSYIMRNTDMMFNFEKIWQDQKLTTYMQGIISTVARTISKYFVDKQPEQPNTLMWGRKEQCWKEVEALKCDANFEFLDRGDSPINFFPVNPALTYIKDPAHFNDQNLWVDLLSWNETHHVLTNEQCRLIDDVRFDIKVSFKENNSKQIQAAEKAFLNAVEAGYTYQ